MSDYELCLLAKKFRLQWEEVLQFRKLSEKSFLSLLCQRTRKKESFILQTLKQEAPLYPEHQVIHPWSKYYPGRFTQLQPVPWLLFYRGPLEKLRAPQLGVVGARSIQPRFAAWMDEHLGKMYAQARPCLLSGGAIGVDQRASRIALKCEGDTIICLPSGLNCIYPSSLRPLVERGQTLLLTEYRADEMVRPYHFYQRNRLIAGLSDLLLVVQGAVKSGTLLTARYALDFGTEVVTLPDFPNCAQSSGNLALIRDGAGIVTSYKDLLVYWQKENGR